MGGRVGVAARRGRRTESSVGAPYYAVGPYFVSARTRSWLTLEDPSPGALGANPLRCAGAFWPSAPTSSFVRAHVHSAGAPKRRLSLRPVVFHA